MMIWFGLFVLLSPMRPGAAQTTPALCSDGYALWANNRTQAETLTMGGSENVITGISRSNADLRISGSKNTFNGAVRYATQFQDGGDQNVYPTPQQLAPSNPPLVYTLADYQPGGSAAVAAQAAGRYTVVNGDFEVSEPTTLSGLYYVTGNAELSASDVRGTFTIVAAGRIEVSGSNHDVRPYAGGLLFFANAQSGDEEVIKLAGGDSTLRGVIYGPRGEIELSGSTNTISGTVLGDTLELSGSKLQISFNAAYCPDPVAPAPGPFRAYLPLLVGP
jgi:hypothetical protein